MVRECSSPGSGTECRRRLRKIIRFFSLRIPPRPLRSTEDFNAKAEAPSFTRASFEPLFLFWQPLSQANFQTSHQGHEGYEAHPLLKQTIPPTDFWSSQHAPAAKYEIGRTQSNHRPFLEIETSFFRLLHDRQDCLPFWKVGACK
jgi:hypothetical protein